MAELKVITPTTNVSPVVAAFPTGATEGQILTWNNTTGRLVWTDPGVATDQQVVDAWEAEDSFLSTSANTTIEFPMSSSRGVTGFTHWKSDEFYIGDDTGIVIEEHEISGWGSTNKTAGSFIVGYQYKILTTGTTDFTLIGAADSNPDTYFVATGVGTGTGTAGEQAPVVLGGQFSTNGIVVDERIDFNTTNHASATANFRMPIYSSKTATFSNTGTDLAAQFTNPIQVDGTSVFNNNFEVIVSNGDNSPAKIERASGLGITSPVLHLETGESQWNKPALLLEDGNGYVTSVVAQHNTSSDFYQLNYTLDPNNTHGRTGATTFAGDYFMSFDKNYSDQSAIKMEQRVFGANGGFNIKVFDDFNSGGGNQYHAKPIRLQGEKIELHTDSSGTPFGSFTETLTVDSTRVTINNLTRLHNASSDPSSPLEGDVYYNTGTDRIKLYTGAGWVTLSVD